MPLTIKPNHNKMYRNFFLDITGKRPLPLEDIEESLYPSIRDDFATEKDYEEDKAFCEEELRKIPGITEEQKQSLLKICQGKFQLEINEDGALTSKVTE